ncbi:MAG: mechanosensitive ion channel [Pirellulales bacterium]|nr:mechanosensitive ion channel [Pirellulales bacterium]
MFTQINHHRRTSKFVAAIIVAVAATCWLYSSEHLAQAQVPPTLQLTKPKKAPEKQEETNSVAERRKDVNERLKRVEQSIQQMESDQATEPPAALTRQVELLTRIETLLSQHATEQEVAEKNKADLSQLQAGLDAFLRRGFSEGERITFLRLDEERNELETELRRLERIVRKEKTALAAFEQAQQEAREQSSARRRSLAKVEQNDNDALRQQLGERLAEAELLSEAAEELSALRKEEKNNAEQEVLRQRLRVDLLKERAARMRTRAIFGTAELNEILMDIDRREDDLENDIAKTKATGDEELKEIKARKIRAQRELKNSAGNRAALDEELAAYDLRIRVIQDRLEILKERLGRLDSDRKSWKRRQHIYSGRPSREDIRHWLEDSEKSLGQLGREEQAAIEKIEDLRNDLTPLKERQKEVSQQSTDANWIKQQITSLRILQETEEQNLSSIRASMRLDRKLLGEMQSDSLAVTAKDRLSDLWNLIGKVWHFELTSFGDRSVTVQKVLTALLVLLAGLFVSKALSRALRRQVLRRLDIDPSASATIQSLFYYTLLVMFGLFALNVAKVPLTAFTVLGGAVALGIGFGSQNIINNFISGLVLMAERPVKVGDLVQINDFYGNIEHIGARSTRVRTGSNLEIIVPNSSFLQGNVINFTLSSNKVRTFVDVGVAYGSPTVTVTQLLRRAAVETGRVAKDPPPIILFKSFGNSALIFEVHFWMHMRVIMDQLQVESAVRFRIDQLFREEGIVIAFPQSDVHLDMPSPLTVKMIENSNGSHDI